MQEVLAGLRDSLSEAQLGAADLLVRLKGDVATDHVEEQDAQGPDCGAFPVIATLADPLGRGVNAGPWRDIGGILTMQLWIAQLSINGVGLTKPLTTCLNPTSTTQVT